MQVKMQTLSRDISTAFFNALNQDLDEDNLEYIKHLIESNLKSPFPFSWLICDADNNSFLHILSRKNNAELTKQILDCVAQEIAKKNPESEENLTNYLTFINNKNDEQKTSLHLACKFANPNLVQLLIDEGADLFLKHPIGGEPLTYAFTQHTDEERTDAEKLAARLNTIKILLKHHTGIGRVNLGQLFKDNKIIPPANEYADIIVIGSGIQHTDPGFEQAICTLEDFSSKVTENQFQSEVLMKVCKKRLSEDPLQTSKLSPLLVEFLQFLDFNSTGNLKRACQRYILSHKQEVTEKTDDLMNKESKVKWLLEPESEDFIISKVAFQINSLLTNLKELTQLLDQDPTLTKAMTELNKANASYQRCKITRNNAFIIAGLLLFLGVSYYGFDTLIFILANCGHRKHTPPPLPECNMKELLSMAFLIVGGSGLGIVVILGIILNYLSQQQSNDSIIPDIPLNDFSIDIPNRKEVIQTTIDQLVAAGAITRTTSNLFYNATHSNSLNLSVDTIKNECEAYLKKNAGKINKLYDFSSKGIFFVPSSAPKEKVSVGADDTRIEMLDDENASLLDRPTLTYGSTNADTFRV